MVEYNYNKKLGVYIMFNYDKIIKELELMNSGESLRFCELLCEKNDTLAFSISIQKFSKEL